MKNNLFKLYIADRVSAVCKNYECDGTSRVIAYLLAQEQEEFRIVSGHVELGEERIPHMWIEWNGYIVDFKSKMWLGPEASEGFFKESKQVYEEYTDDSERLAKAHEENIRVGKLLHDVKFNFKRHA